MDYQRAQEIIESHGVIGLCYQDSPVWLEQIQMDHETAEVINLDNEQRLEVPLTELREDNI